MTTLRVDARTIGQILLILIIGAYACDAVAQCYPHIVGYMHPYDVVPQQMCNFFGCQVVPSQIPCQHPIWRC